MKITLQDLLTNAFVISIDSLRYSIFCDTFNKYKLNCPMPELYTGFTVPNGTFDDAGFSKTTNVLNCTLSHLALIKYAQFKNLPFICIFEDDAYPRKDIIEKLEYYMSDIPDDTDVLKLGSIKTHSVIKQRGKFEYSITRGTHAYIVFNRYYQRYIDTISLGHIIVDHTATNAYKINKDYNILNTKENLFIQYQQKEYQVLNGFKDKTFLEKRLGQKNLEFFELT